MKETGMIFSTLMVKAIRDGTKIQTRRLLKEQPIDVLPMNDIKDGWVTLSETNPNHGKWIKCRYGGVGDRLWVRETHYRCGQWVMNGFTKTGKPAWKFKPCQDSTTIFYYDDPPSVISHGREFIGWWKRPSIFMPRLASRITLEITEVRVERLLDISEADAKAEGFSSVEEFLHYWDILNKKRGYGTDVNPWDWPISFKVVTLK